MEVSGLGRSEWSNNSVPPGLSNWSFVDNVDVWGEAAMAPLDNLSGLRTFITLVYSVVCAVGLLGNGLVMYLIWAQKGTRAPVINVFVFGLAVADFQFSLTLPFWAVETFLDFTWPFGQVLCKAIPFLTVLSIYANVFLLTAMSVTRYWSLASALKDGRRMTPRLAKWITLALWGMALGTSVPATIYTTVVHIAGVEVCIFKFPTPFWLGVYHLQKVVITFAIPLVVISISYLLLLRLLRSHRVNGNSPKRQNQVATTVRLVVGCFFVCWFPNHVATIWGVLVKFKAVRMDETFFFLQNYIFPLTKCLAHSSSCLNPVLYCLIRKDFWEAMKETFRRVSKMAASLQHSSAHKTMEEAMLMVVPLSPSGPPHNSKSVEKEDSTLSTILEPRAKAADLGAEVQMLPGVEIPM
ncbi:relaxin-3 receptor 2 [Hemicordylus capensis]|uniref:relaxin-3 receptor 2 n=1 Tax=Hemicordylus capensis TaxID=884348 RepID=UPI0023039989|nr:relaxin-3 receptor 2 [Hemicordylus capensis]